MDNSFLCHVAHHIINTWGTDLSRTAVVFPNKRAALFLDEYIAHIAEKPVWSPSYITISDLFRRHSTLTVGDPIKLICDLHKSFVKCTGLNETLDHFYSWGQLMLADFDDIDKNMADVDKIFCNLKDLHALDDISYLTEEQKEMLKQFFLNFTDDKESELKQRFLDLWSHFGDIYHDYNKRLAQQNLGYEGAVYRSVVANNELPTEYERYLFVGFNLLHKVELQLFKQIKKAGKAHFFWDYDHYYMPKGNTLDSSTSAGHYIASYLADFPNELDNTDPRIYDNMRQKKNITFMTATTDNAQARYVGKWLKENNRSNYGRRTAVVMCDENLLLPVMHSIPTDTCKANITSGFPLAMTPVATLIAQLFDMHASSKRSKGKSYKATDACKLLVHPYARYISEKAKEVYMQLKSEHILYPSVQMLTNNGTDEGLCMIFDKNINNNSKMLKMMSSVVKRIGVNAKDQNAPLRQESLFRMYTILNRLAGLVDNGDLVVDDITLRRLCKQLVATTTIPFHGEPIEGIQIMGVLETRNLDFDHLLLLSCSEGNMPKGVNDSSFIPYSIRKAHGLTTIDHKVAVYSYHFHRLIQRASDITIAYNNATNDGHTGEQSRFMLQLMLDERHTINHSNLIADNKPTELTTRAIPKDNTIMAILNNMKSISPSAINCYIRCPKSFYYQQIAGIREPDAADDTIDNRMFGNIFHRSAQLIYEDITKRNTIVQKTHIEKYLENKALLEDVVDQAFSEELFKTKQSSTTHQYNGLQIINREVLLEYLRQLLKTDIAIAPFSIICLEGKAYKDITFCTHDEASRTISIGGIIDRLDATVDDEGIKQQLRVIDYKTGRQPIAKINSIDDVFAGRNTANTHSDYFLQALLYSLIVADSDTLNPNHAPVAPALLFIKHASKAEYNPIIEINNQRINDATIFADDFKEQMNNVLANIFSQDTPFAPTEDTKKCDGCPYKALCVV